MKERRMAQFSSRGEHSGGHPASNVPLTVKFTAALMWVIGTYLLLFYGALGVTAGLFIGPHILIPALVCTLLGLALLVSGNGLLNRKRWSRRVLWVASTFVILGVPAMLARDAINDGKIPNGAWFLMPFPIVFAVMSLLALSKSTTRWLDRPSE